MKKRSEPQTADPSLRDKILGLGERSIRKSYYPQLQKQLEDMEAVRKELAESQARYRSLVENINDVIFSLNAEGVVTYVSPVIQSLCGFVPEEIVGKSFREFVHPEDMPVLAASFERVLAGNLSPQEYRVLVKDGGFRYVRSSSRPLLEAGRVIGLTGVMSDITKHKQADKELLAREQLFRALVENSPDFVARYDLEYRRIYVNPAILSLFKTPPENVLGQTPADQSPVKTPQVYIDRLRQVIETASECTLETPFRTAQGEMHWGQIRFVPEFDANGKVASVLTIGRDVHEIKESEQRLRRFIANLPAFFFTFRRNGDGRYCFPYASPGIKTIYGLDPEDVREDMAPLHMLAHPDDRPRIEAGIARAFETLEPFGVEFRVCRPDMPERWIEARSISHEEADGSILWYGIMLDVTERKQATEALAASEKLQRLLLDTLTQQIFYKDRDSVYIACNKAFASGQGIEPKEVAGKTDRDLFPPELAERYRADDLAVMELGETRDIEEPYERDGKEYWVHTVKTPTRDAGGNITGVLGIFWDVTEQKLADIALVRVNRTLKMLSAGNEVLVRGTNEDNLLRDMCRVIVEVGGYRMAWVGYAEHDEAKTVRPVAWAGVDSGYVANAELSWSADVEHGQGPAGNSIRSGRTIHVQDFASDSQMVPWRENALQRGYQSGVALPLKDESAQVFGALLIYSAEQNVITQDEIGLLEELAGDLAFGIVSLRARRERSQTLERLRESLVDTIGAVSLMVEKRDPYTAGHQNKVARLCVDIGKELGLDEDRLEGLRLGAMIHDIGKIYVPAEILSRPGRLSEVEYAIIKEHPQIGHEIVKNIKFPWPVAEMILQHHERLDGSGYPNGLKAQAILLESKIIAVADVVEAMMSHRPYRPALGPERAMQEIEASRGEKFEPDVVDACRHLFRDRGFSFD